LLKLAHVRASERVDRLLLVTDEKEPRPLDGIATADVTQQQTEQTRLDGTHVLCLVDHEVAIAAAAGGEDGGR
jgi:hypothetical protein